MRKKIIFFKLVLAFLFVALLFSIVILRGYEQYASRSCIVNISKRIIAEAGAFLSGNFIRNENDTGVTFGPEIIDSAKLTTLEEKIYKLNRIESSGTAIRVISLTDYPYNKHARDFQYESFSHPQLITLRQKYKLDELVSGAKTELERFVILKDWIRRKIQRGYPKNIDYNFDALDILSRAERQEKFFCSEYSTVFVQCALSLGFNARYVGLFVGHALAEVWSNEFVKWVIMDVDRNVYFEKDGFPLGALELHNICESKDFSGVKALRGIERNEIDKTERNELIEYYHEFFVRMRNDWFSRHYPHWHHRGNSVMNSLEWQDQYTSNHILVARETNDKDRINFPLNTVSIMVDTQGFEGEQMRLVFGTFTPNFSHFVILVDNKEAVIQENQFFTWKLNKGLNKLSVMAVNSLGNKGPASYAELSLDS